MTDRSREVNKPTELPETRVSTSEASKSFGEIMDRAADGERFVVTRFERERIVILSKREYDRLLELAGTKPRVAAAV